MLSANIYDKATGERKFQAYEMFEKQGIKIAVIGLTTEDTQKIGNPEFIAAVSISVTPKEEAKKLIAELKVKKQKNQIWFLLWLTWAITKMVSVNAPGDVALARYLNEGDLWRSLVVTQEPVCMEGPNVAKKNFARWTSVSQTYKNGTYIVQAHEWVNT